MSSTYDKREQTINDKHIENEATKDAHCPLPLEEKGGICRSKRMLNNNVMPNTVVASRVIYHNLLKLNATPTPSPSLKKKACFLRVVIHLCLKAPVRSQLPSCSPGRAVVLIYKAISKPSSS